MCNAQGRYRFRCSNGSCQGVNNSGWQEGQIILCSTCQECPFCHQAINYDSGCQTISADSTASEVATESTQTLSSGNNQQSYDNMSCERLKVELQLRDLQIENLKNKYEMEKKKYEMERKLRTGVEKMCTGLRQQLDDLEVFGDWEFASAGHTGPNMPNGDADDKDACSAGDTGHLPNTYRGPPLIERSHSMRLLKISRVLALILRHKAEDKGIEVRSDGFVELSKVLTLLRPLRASVQDVREVVKDSRHRDGSSRFELCDLGLLIRATDMHTIPGVSVDTSNTNADGPAQQTTANPQTGSPVSRTGMQNTGEGSPTTNTVITSFGRCLGDFDGTSYGPEYLVLHKDDEVDIINHPEADQDWVFGQAHGHQGWLPNEFWEHR